MEFITHLVDEKYKLFNVNDEKAPINRHGKPMGAWNDMSFEELCAEHDYQSTLWGMKLGEQPNGKHIMSLDFDLYDRKTQQTDKKTELRFENYHSVINKTDGMGIGINGFKLTVL